jgi:hypothetical protein
MRRPFSKSIPIIKRCCAAALALAAFASGNVQAEVVLLGSDYLHTEAGTFFDPIGPLTGLPIGPGITDTIVQRHGDCALDLLANGSNCSVPIEIVALSLVSTLAPNIHVRESPTLLSAGQLTLTSNGSGSGGSFNSFFDLYIEISVDNGTSWGPAFSKQFTSTGSNWTTTPTGMLVTGLVGDPLANNHINKVSGQVDFFLDGLAIHDTGGGRHVVSNVVSNVPESDTLSMFGLGLLVLTGLVQRRRQRRHQSA